MTDQPDLRNGESRSAENNSSVIDLREYRQSRDLVPVTFHRRELDAILWLYGRMVGEGEWRDYAIDHLSEKAVFSIFKRAGEVPLFRIEKIPKLAAKQGAYAVVNASGVILKRGHELAQVLKVFNKSLKLVDK